MLKAYLNLTKRIKEVSYFLNAACDNFNVFSIGPVLLNRSLVWTWLSM